MTYDVLLGLSDFCQSFTVLISLSAYLPQWQQMYKNKSSQNISLSAWIIWSISACLSLFYAVVQLTAHGTAYALVFSSTMSLLFIAATVILIVRYRHMEKGAAKQSPLNSDQQNVHHELHIEHTCQATA